MEVIIHENKNQKIKDNDTMYIVGGIQYSKDFFSIDELKVFYN